MSDLIVVYGGQWGSEGKGQVLAAAANIREKKQFVCVRVGGPNAGHTVTAVDESVVKAQQIPVCAFTHPLATPVLGCSAVVLPGVLYRELGVLQQVWRGRRGRSSPVFIDAQAVVITDELLQSETELKTRIGSTGEGVGAATAAKVMRTGLLFGEWVNQKSGGLSQWGEWQSMATITDSVEMLSRPLGNVYLEGTQGYLLSLNTSGYYPYCTSRDCGPEALLGQAGLTPRAFDSSMILCVLRTFPIRVGGNSGPLPREIAWDDLRSRTGGYVSVPERTTVTNKVRRIAEWDDEIVSRVIRETRPTHLAITFLDYLFPQEAHKRTQAELGPASQKWLYNLQSRLHVEIALVSTGAGQQYTFEVSL